MKKILLLFCLFYYNNSFTQNFESGKIFFQNGDSLVGFIKDNRLGKMTQSCIYRDKIENQNSILYRPFEISYFLENNKRFESTAFVENGKNKNIFSLVLVKGKISLYQYSPNGFLIKKNDSIQILKKVQRIRAGDKYVDKQLYIYQIDSLCNDCINRYTFIEKLDYKVENLTEAISKYNQCVGNQEYKISKEKNLTRFGGKLLFGSGEFNSTGVKESSLFYGAGIFFQIAGDNRVNRRLSTTVEANISKYSFEKIKYNPSFLGINLLLQYALRNPQEKGFPFFELGFSTNQRVNGEKKFQKSGFGLATPIGIGYQSGWKSTSKTKLNLGVRYYQFINAPVYQIRNIVAIVGLSF
ncbi:MAG: hypothetical protein LCH67_02205 [Bacteroidetes bacterium]|nr:hypothetical protein [Bacteroidota bacterium]